MFCIHCGKELPEGARFCIFCGKAAVVSESPAPSQAPEQEVSAPTSPVEDPVTVPPSTEDTPKVSLTENSPESSVALESKLQPEEEASAAALKKAVDCQVTFMRWDTSGPELTITFSQNDPITISSGESRTVTLPGGTQHISLDTASQHSEFEISLDTDIKVNLRWNAESGLFSADCSVRENFKSTASAPTTAPTSPSASTSAAASSSTATPETEFSWEYKRSFAGSLPRKISCAVKITDGSLSLAQRDRLPFNQKILESKKTILLSDIRKIIFQPKASIYFWLICGFLLAFLPAAAILYATAIIAPPDIVFGFGVAAILLGVFNLFFYRFQLYHYRLTLVDQNGNATKIEAQGQEALENLSLDVSRKTGVSCQKKDNSILIVIVSACIGIAIAIGGLLLLFPSNGPQVTGVWKFDHSIIEGEKMTAADLGTDMYIYLSEDGSAEVTADYGSVEREFGKWELVDSKTLLLTLTSAGEEMLFSRSRNTLSAPYDGATMYFTRSSISPSQIPVPNLASGADKTQKFTEHPVPISTPVPTTDSGILYITYDGDIDIYDFIGEYGGIDNDPPELDDMEGLSISWEDSDTIYFTSGGYRELHFDLYADCADLAGNRLDITDENGDRYAFYYLPALSSPYHKDTIYWSLNPESDDYWTDYKAYVRNNDTENYDTADFSWLEAEYANDDGDEWLSMTLQVDEFESDALYFCFYSTSWADGNTEIIADGRVSYVGGGETPRFEGYLFSIMESITIEYTGNDSFTVNCPTLGFSDVSFFYYAEL